jgi:GalNAc-alpha-(1->4)-GalNAc-alpha-(1->3)-diNAcBac-PP-undecaprenol alpha-1,4-N-acetyl-D-galactosaminyltransferase
VARRIVILIGSMARGGAERVAATLANAWADQGREVWLVSTYLGPRADGYPLRPNVSIAHLSDETRGWCGGRLAGVCKLVALRRLVRRAAPEAVISFLTNVNILAVAALAGTKLPLIASERVDPAGDIEMHWIVRCARALSYRWVDALVVQTASVADRYRARRWGLRRITVIPNPLPQELDASRVRAQHPAGGGVVIAMGRLTQQKGFTTLIAAYAKALGDNGSWVLQIWGEGPQHAELGRLIASLHLEERVRLCGVTSQPWVQLAAAQIFVLSSRYEGFPNAMLEAMAVGLPCIAFDCPSGPRELADGGAAAIIVPQGDEPRLAGELRRMARDREGRRALGERAAAHVRREFGQQRIVADWDRLMSQLLPGESAPASMRRGT